MTRFALVALLAGCTDPVMEEPEPLAAIDAELGRGSDGQTTVKGCFLDGWLCTDGTDPMRVRWNDNEIVAPYKAAILGGRYEATTDQIAGGDIVDVELDGDIASIEMPLDNDFMVPAVPLHASNATTVQWKPSTNAMSTQLTAYWLCNDSQGGTWSPAVLATFDVDPGTATVDVLGSRAAHLHDRTCEVSIGVTAKIYAKGERIGIVARQWRRLDLILDEPGPLP